ncbi:MAG: ChbG/HpnK family deacetylase, partial [Alphaproteobacteria bacterium]|nr:ChbG/HpnK family deacetylase [Alphaproteobacteria bacterium]
MKSLVITADDFGAAKEVNDAVETAHRHGVLTAASLMVTGAAAADAVARAKAMPSLRVGLHLVLVDGTAALPVSQVASLVRGGRFDSNMARAGAAMFFRPKARRELAREIEAQFQAFAATGLALDHVNTH